MNAEGEAQWGENGIPVTGNTNHQDSPQILSDGSGGAFITWEGGGGDGYEDIFAQHINSAGSLQWGADGVHVCDRPRGQRDIRITRRLSENTKIKQAQILINRIFYYRGEFFFTIYPFS